jgi:hypothetical protein
MQIEIILYDFNNVILMRNTSEWECHTLSDGECEYNQIIRATQPLQMQPITWGTLHHFQLIAHDTPEVFGNHKFPIIVYEGTIGINAADLIVYNISVDPNAIFTINLMDIQAKPGFWSLLYKPFGKRILTGQHSLFDEV